MELITNYNDKTIKLRTATADDVDYLLKWWNDGEIMEHAGFPLGLNTTAEKVQKSIAKSSEVYQLLIMEFEGIPFGEMTFSIENNVADFGIKICVKTLRNKGVGPVVLKALFQYLFDLGVEKICCDTNPNNARARHFYENKMGMKQVKIKENCWTNQLGEPQGIVFFEITKEEFENNKN